MSSPHALSGQCILVLEDEPLITLDVVDALRRTGASIVSARSSHDALHQMNKHKVTAAVLDVHLGTNDDCGDVCEELTRQGVPFLFYTAYGNVRVLEEWDNIPVVSKPAYPSEITATLTRLVVSQCHLVG